MVTDENSADRPRGTKAAVLITSCDAFEDCWEPYAHGLETYWPDCPYPVRLIVNDKEFKRGKIRTLRVSPDRGWATNLRLALQRIEEDVVLYTHEDFWIQAPVNTAAICDYVDIVTRGLADYIRLYPCPPPDRPYEADRRLGVLDVIAPYRASLQAALWRKSVLLDLLREEESCWEFEAKGTIRSRGYGDAFLCVAPSWGEDRTRSHVGLDYVCTAINKGRWSRAAIHYAQREGLAVDFSKRPRETWWDDFLRDSLLGLQVGRALWAAQNPRRTLLRLLGLRSGKR
jgi:hypothetical protein